MAVDEAGSSGRKRKKMCGAAEEVENEEEEEQKEENEVEEELVEQEEENEGEEREKIEEGGDFGSSNGSQTVVRIDTDVLDCSICCEPFRPPIYQCQNGHVVCSPCCISLSGKCHVCSQPIGLIRCLALESVMESVQIRCRNARYGCNATFSYLHQDTHHKICKYRQRTCPVPPCAFKGTLRSLTHHFLRHHTVNFSYGHCFYVAVFPTENPFLLLRGPDRSLFMLLNNTDTTRGSALSMICISSRNEKPNFEYELSVGDYPTTLKLKTPIENTTEWKGPTDIFLFVPKDFHSPNKIAVHVTIYKC